jgi:hypothetical protein
LQARLVRGGGSDGFNTSSHHIHHVQQALHQHGINQARKHEPHYWLLWASTFIILSATWEDTSSSEREKMLDEIIRYEDKVRGEPHPLSKTYNP